MFHENKVRKVAQVSNPDYDPNHGSATAIRSKYLRSFANENKVDNTEHPMQIKMKKSASSSFFNNEPPMSAQPQNLKKLHGSKEEFKHRGRLILKNQQMTNQPRNRRFNEALENQFTGPISGRKESGTVTALDLRSIKSTEDRD